ncbi:rhomboid family intramembrane serine protease GlpG [soil metagenome]
MRQIGTLPEEQPARAFADYLLTLDISSDLKPASEGWAIWVHKEDLVPRAKEELTGFQANPDDPRYQNSAQEAEAIRRKAEQLDRQHARKTHDLRGKLRGGPMGLTPTGPLTRMMISISVVVTLMQWLKIELFGAPIEYWLLFSVWVPSPVGPPRSLGFEPILSGQFWRLVTPIFLHSTRSPFHILFNMYMLYQLGKMIEARRKLWEYGLLILFTALVSNISQFLLPDMFTMPGFRTGGGPFVGMSGVVYGLFGYAWVKSRFEPASGLFLHPNTVLLLLIWLVVCAFNIVGPIANTAHVAGMLAGMVVAGVPVWRERWRI